ncbi:hypothetical protein EST38_g13288 [Candolleomyces aberdarensis]|uniref:Uncharacterized protein n=1 Tax=Candolleomyces aberdarensis TaxID=2316362 RepID=A0A4Q2D281_9AGAR|nr:hypothetical protein EST38_g13288 [Candolleomyces aberdarensis]
MPPHPLHSFEVTQTWGTQVKNAILADTPVTLASIPSTCQADLSSVARVFSRTYSNRAVVPWLWEDVEEMLTSFRIPEGDWNAFLERYFEDSLLCPKSLLQVFNTPTLFCDTLGNIVLWYIPGAFGADHQTQATRAAYPDTQRFPNSILDINQEDGVLQKAGSTDVLHGEEGRLMLSHLRNTNRILASWLSLVHPTLFAQQMKLHQALYSEDCKHMLRNPGFIYPSYTNWTSPFPGFMLSGNQLLSFRKDEANIHTFHALLAFGTHSGGRVKIPSLRAAFDFEPGCAIFFPAAAMRYSVEAAPSGQRVVMRTYCDTKLGWKAMGHKYALGLRRPTLDFIEKQLTPRRLIPFVEQNELHMSNSHSIDNPDYVRYY